MEINTRWIKVKNEMKTSLGRTAMMIAAIAVSVMGTAAIMSSYAVAGRESALNYKNTHPATALIELDDADDALVAGVKKLPQVDQAENCSIITARLKTKNDGWMPMLLFVVRDFNDMRLNTVKSESGAWPPPAGTLLVERRAMEIMKATVGEKFMVQLPGGPVMGALISGTVHDPGLVPAWQEQTAYVYITQETFKMLGGKGGLHALKIRLKDGYLRSKDIEKNIAAVAAWIKSQGRTIEDIRIPPSDKHPHQSQMNAVFYMLFVFGFMALALSAILSASMINAMLAQQVKQIGIMKTIGGRSVQIAGMYLSQIIIVGIISVCIGIPLGIAAGSAFAGVIGSLLNIDLTSKAVPLWVYAVQISSGILIPFFAALIPVVNASNITVAGAINDYGISRNNAGSAMLDLLLAKIPVINRTVAMAVRNVFRKKSRLILTVGMLAAAGGMFMAGQNIKDAWKDVITKTVLARTFSIEIRFNNPVGEKNITRLISSVPGVKQVSSWNMAYAGVLRPDDLMIVRTYPDGGHGSLTLRSMPDTKSLANMQVLQGAYPAVFEKGTVILNHTAVNFFPGVKAGDVIGLNIYGKHLLLKVTAVVKEILMPSTAYVSPETFAAVTKNTDMTNCVRIMTAGKNKTEKMKIADEIETVLEKQKAGVKMFISAERLDNAQSGHVLIFIIVLIIMSIIMGFTGLIGLMSSVSTSVTEKTREIGIMRAIGAKEKRIYLTIISEGLFTGILSWLFAVAVSIPLSILCGNIFGNMSFKIPLAPVISWTGVVLWALIIIIGSVIASLIPAKKAAALTVRETLSYY